MRGAYGHRRVEFHEAARRVGAGGVADGVVTHERVSRVTEVSHLHAQAVGRAPDGVVTHERVDQALLGLVPKRAGVEHGRVVGAGVVGQRDAGEIGWRDSVRAGRVDEAPGLAARYVGDLCTCTYM